MNETTYNYAAQLQHKPEVKAFFHPPSFTWSYVVADPTTKQCAIIDSVLDYDLPSGTLSYESADTIDAFRQIADTVDRRRRMSYMCQSGTGSSSGNFCVS